LAFDASLAAAGLTLTLAASSASAFSVSSAVSTPCHEPITMAALRNARALQPAAAPLTSSGRNDLAIVDDVPFGLDLDMRDLGAVSLLIGVRDNDLKGRDPNELDSLALIHGDPAGQREHCLRGPGDDEPNGSDAALRECRGFIREMFVDALDGLDGEGRPTLDARLDTWVGLSLRGKVRVGLPRFYVRMGQAIHALQDGFTHTYRPEDRTRVSVALNYVDVVNRNYLPERDGPRHSMELDRCDATDGLRARNRELAVEASTRVLTTALEPGLSREQKVAALEALLDQYLAYQSGCTDANGWCDAPETALESAAGCGCTQGSGSSAFFAAALALLAIRRGRRRSAPAVGTLLLLCLVLPVAAWAQVTPEPQPAAEASPPIDSKEAAEVGATVPITASEVQAVQKEEQTRRSLFSIYAAGGGSLYNVGVAGILGVRFRLNDYWQLGVDGEINGWYGIHAQRMRTATCRSCCATRCGSSRSTSARPFSSASRFRCSTSPESPPAASACSAASTRSGSRSS